MTDTLQPPEMLTPPEPVKPVTREKAPGMVPVAPEMLQQLDVKADQFVDAVLTHSVQDEEFKDRVDRVHNLGSVEIRKAASVSSRILDRPARAMESGMFDEKSKISSSLTKLRSTVEDLDPSKQGDLLSPNKILGIIPFGNKIRDYFLKYQSSQTHLNKIIESLYNGQDELRKDNAAIEEEKANLWAIMGKLQQYIYVGKKIDTALETRVATMEAAEPEKARIVKEELLFYVRQKVQDLLTQLSVSIQGYLALDMIRKNNLELIKGVDRATTTTVSALRTAVIVAQALANQKLVLDQINALNTTTGNIIEATSELLKGQSAEIHKQASDSAVAVEKLQASFNNIFEAMDNLSTFKTQALVNMKETVNVLTDGVEEANKYLDKVRAQESAGAVADLKLNMGDEIVL